MMKCDDETVNRAEISNNLYRLRTECMQNCANVQNLQVRCIFP